MKIIYTKNIIEFDLIEILNSLKKENIEIFKEKKMDSIYFFLKKYEKYNHIRLCKNAYNNILSLLINKFKMKKEINIYYDLIINYKSYISNFVIQKINFFISKLLETNSKNILLIDNIIERWGTIFGDLEINRKDIYIKTSNYINNLLKKYNMIKSNIIIYNIGFEIDEYKKLKISDDIKLTKFYIIDKQRETYLKYISKKSLNKKYKNSLLDIYKKNVLKKRKKNIFSYKLNKKLNYSK